MLWCSVLTEVQGWRSYTRTITSCTCQTREKHSTWPSRLSVSSGVTGVFFHSTLWSGGQMVFLRDILVEQQGRNVNFLSGMLWFFCLTGTLLNTARVHVKRTKRERPQRSQLSLELCSQSVQLIWFENHVEKVKPSWRSSQEKPSQSLSRSFSSSAVELHFDTTWFHPSSCESNTEHTHTPNISERSPQRSSGITERE